MALYAIDGTDSERKHKSNVVEFAKRYRCPYVGNARYFSGPSTPASQYGQGAMAMLFGVGSRHLVETVVDSIAKDRKVHPNLPIDLVGFSRGAAIANEVAYVLSTKGILLERDEHHSVTDVPSIRFMGLFDPVHSMGFPIPIWDGSVAGLSFDRLVFTGNRRWCMDKVPENVKSVFIIYARDEARTIMRPSDLHFELPSRGHVRKAIVMPGVHSEDGGYDDPKQFNPHLSRMTLRAMIEKAVSVDVPVSVWGLISDAEVHRLDLRGELSSRKGRIARDRLFY